jgi:hypothetical protein
MPPEATWILCIVLWLFGVILNLMYDKEETPSMKHVGKLVIVLTSALFVGMTKTVADLKGTWLATGLAVVFVFIGMVIQIASVRAGVNDSRPRRAGDLMVFLGLIMSTLVAGLVAGEKLTWRFIEAQSISGTLDSAELTPPSEIYEVGDIQRRALDTAEVLKGLQTNRGNSNPTFAKVYDDKIRKAQIVAARAAIIARTEDAKTGDAEAPIFKLDAQVEQIKRAMGVAEPGSDLYNDLAIQKSDLELQLNNALVVYAQKTSPYTLPVAPVPAAPFAQPGFFARMRGGGAAAPAPASAIAPAPRVGGQEVPFGTQLREELAEIWRRFSAGAPVPAPAAATPEEQEELSAAELAARYADAARVAAAAARAAVEAAEAITAKAAAAKAAATAAKAAADEAAAAAANEAAAARDAAAAAAAGEARASAEALARAKAEAELAAAAEKVAKTAALEKALADAEAAALARTAALAKAEEADRAAAEAAAAFKVLADAIKAEAEAKAKAAAEVNRIDRDAILARVAEQTRSRQEAEAAKLAAPGRAALIAQRIFGSKAPPPPSTAAAEAEAAAEAAPAGAGAAEAAETDDEFEDTVEGNANAGNLANAPHNAPPEEVTATANAVQRASDRAASYRAAAANANRANRARLDNAAEAERARREAAAAAAAAMPRRGNAVRGVVKGLARGVAGLLPSQGPPPFTAPWPAGALPPGPPLPLPPGLPRRDALLRVAADVDP